MCLGLELNGYFDVLLLFLVNTNGHHGISKVHFACEISYIKYQRRVQNPVKHLR